MTSVHKLFALTLGLFAGLSLNACTTLSAPPMEVPQAQIATKSTFADVLHGDFNNYLQTWQQKEDEVDVPFPNEHITLQSVADEPSLAGVTLASRALVGQPESTQRRWYTWSTSNNAQVGEAWALHDSAQAPVTLSKLTRDPACDMTWVSAADGYELAAINAQCSLLRDISGLQLSRNGLAATVNGDVWTFKRVRQFTGWMGVKKQRWDPEAGEDDWVFMGKFGIHNEGEAVQLVEKDGTPTGYAVKLERLLYQNTRTPVLKLGLIEESTKKTITYIWSEPGSRRLGMNLRWFQVGLTAVEE